MYSLFNKTHPLQIVKNAVSCNCLVFLSKSKLWKDLCKGKIIEFDRINKLKKSITYKTIFSTLVHSDLIFKNEVGYGFTEAGHDIQGYIGLINMLFEGYAPLMEKQGELATNQFSINKTSSLLNGKSIADASISFGKKTVDPVVFEEFSKLQFSGTICDLGCGECTRLLELCKMTNHPGLGIDNCKIVVDNAIKELKKVKEPTVFCEHGDITKLDGIWEDIVILMQYFVFHDFNPSGKCKRMINSYLDNFPNLKYFFYVDIVAPSESHPDIMPGFDYVHGLMGIKTRTYEETIKMFENSKFKVMKERPIEGLPNTYLWILAPRKRKKSVVT